MSLEDQKDLKLAVIVSLFIFLIGIVIGKFIC